MKQKTRAPSLSVLQQIKKQKRKSHFREKSVLGLTVFYLPFNLFQSAQKCEITNQTHNLLLCLMDSATAEKHQTI